MGGPGGRLLLSLVVGTKLLHTLFYTYISYTNVKLHTYDFQLPIISYFF